MPLETPFDATSDQACKFYTVPSPRTYCVSSPNNHIKLIFVPQAYYMAHG